MHIRELYNYHKKHTIRAAKHDVENVFLKFVNDYTTLTGESLENKRVLDLGCGQRFPFALQCSASGCKTTAIDTNYVKPDNLPIAFLKTIKYNGIDRAFKSLLRRILFDKQYFDVLNKQSKMTLESQAKSITFIVADPVKPHYPLPDNSFDFIASNAVLEHVNKVSCFAEEVARLLDIGGVFQAIIYNYYSLSGGHNMEWAYPDEHSSSKIPPWDHLRENMFPTFVYLNKYKPDQYIDAFSKVLDIVEFTGVDINHETDRYEGAKIITPDLSSELNQYSEELLLTRAWKLICKKS